MRCVIVASYGKPTIGPDHGGFTEIIGKGENAIGRLFRPNDIEDLGNKIVALWNSSDEVRVLGNRAFKKLQEEYSSDVAYQKWEKLFESLIKR